MVREFCWTICECIQTWYSWVCARNIPRVVRVTSRIVPWIFMCSWRNSKSLMVFRTIWAWLSDHPWEHNSCVLRTSKLKSIRRVFACWKDLGMVKRVNNTLKFLQTQRHWAKLISIKDEPNSLHFACPIQSNASPLHNSSCKHLSIQTTRGSTTTLVS
jgi:hypothetical protein